jgi:hypothetical protein
MIQRVRSSRFVCSNNEGEPLNRGCVIQQMRQKEKADAEKKALLDHKIRIEVVDLAAA